MMRWLLMILTVLALALSCWAFEMSTPPNRYKLGNTLTAGTGARYSTVAAAAAAATSGDEVLVVPGTYTETSIIIPDGVSVRGCGPATLFANNTNMVFRPRGNCTISDLKIVNNKTSSGGHALGMLGTDTPYVDGKTVTVENCDLRGDYDTAIIRSGNWTFRNCRLAGGYTGFQISPGGTEAMSVTLIDCLYVLDNTSAASGNTIFVRSDGAPAVSFAAYGCSLVGTSSQGSGAYAFGILAGAWSADRTTSYIGIGNSWRWDVSATTSPVQWFYQYTTGGTNGTLSVYSYDEKFEARGASTVRIFSGVNTANRFVFHGGNAGTLMDSVIGGATAVFGYHPDGPDYGIIEETVNFASHTEAWKALSTAVPAGAVIISAQANVDVALTTGGTTTHVALGIHDGDVDAYGIVGTLTKNSQINTQIAQASLTELVGATTIDVCGVANDHATLGDTDITAGKVFVRIVYRKVPAIRTVP